MKRQFNLTDCKWDLDRFASRADLLEMLADFDGIELMHMEEDERGIIDRNMVVGYHITQPQYWMDFWRGDWDRCVREFDTKQKAITYYGGDSPDILVEKTRHEYNRAVDYGAEYLVIHVSDASAFEEITGKYHYTDREVVDEFCSLLNAALSDHMESISQSHMPHTFHLQKSRDSSVMGCRRKEAYGGLRPHDETERPWVLLENLWQPGLTFCDPAITERLLEGINYPKMGIMLDTGHLLHTHPSLRTQKEAVSYIHQQLDAHGDLCRNIRGVHLNQSLSGRVMNRYRKNPPTPAATYEERMSQLFAYIFQVDLHRPFVGEGVRELIDRIAPDYLTFEFITRDLPEHQRMLQRQLKVFSN